MKPVQINNKKMNQIKTILCALIICANTFPTFSQGFEVSPVVMNYSAEPGTSETQKLTIANLFSQRRAFSLVLGDFDRDANGTKSYTEAGSMPTSASDWITISPSYVEVNPNETKEITVTITVPNGANDTRWTMIYVKATKEQTSHNADKGFAGGVVISPTIGVQVYQSPGSNTSYEATVSDFKEITKPGEDQRTLAVTVDNKGGKNLKCSMYLLIADLQTATEVKSSPVVFPLLPGRKQIAKLPVPKDLKPGKYSVAAILDYGHGSDLEGIQMELIVK